MGLCGIRKGSNDTKEILHKEQEEANVNSCSEELRVGEH